MNQGLLYGAGCTLLFAAGALMYPILVGENAEKILSAASDLATVVGLAVAVFAYGNWRKEHAHAEKHKRLFDLEAINDSFSDLQGYAFAIYEYGSKRISGADTSTAFGEVELKRKQYFRSSSAYQSICRRAQLFLSPEERSSFSWDFEKLESVYNGLSDLYLDAQRATRTEADAVDFYNSYRSARDGLIEMQAMARDEIYKRIELTI